MKYTKWRLNDFPSRAIGAVVHLDPAAACVVVPAGLDAVPEVKVVLRRAVERVKGCRAVPPVAIQACCIATAHIGAIVGEAA
jgi:hypothetical protein